MLFEKIKHHANVLILNLKKNNRTDFLVNKEYNEGNWNKASLDNHELSLHSMYGLTDDDVGLFIDHGKWIHGTYGEYELKYWNQILHELLPFKDEPIVELGCGLGNNLFRLKQNGFTNLSGYDISSNAIDFATKFNEKIDAGINFKQLDLRNTMPDFTDKIVFSHACLEQLKHSMKQVVQNLIISNPKLVFNFEVDYDNAPFIVRKYMDSRDFQNNLVRELKNNSNVDLLSIHEFTFHFTHINNISTIKWKPKK